MGICKHFKKLTICPVSVAGLIVKKRNFQPIPLISSIQKLHNVSRMHTENNIK